MNTMDKINKIESSREMEDYDERLERSFCIFPEDHEIPRKDFDFNGAYEYPDKHDDVDLSDFSFEESETIIRVSLLYGMCYSDVIEYSHNCTNCVGKLCVWKRGCNGINNTNRDVAYQLPYTTEEEETRCWHMTDENWDMIDEETRCKSVKLDCEFDNYLNQYQAITVNDDPDVEQFPNQFLDQRIDTFFANYHRGHQHSTSCLSFNDTKCGVCEQLIAKNEMYVFKWGAQCCNECSHKLNECFMTEGEISDLNDKWDSDMTKYDCRRVFGMPNYITLCNYSHLKK